MSSLFSVSLTVLKIILELVCLVYSFKKYFQYREAMFTSFTAFSIYYLSELFCSELTISSLSFLKYLQQVTGFSTKTSNSTDSTELYESVFHKSLFSLSDFIFSLS